MKPLNPNSLLSICEVAGYCRCHTETVARWIRQGKLRAIRLPGGRIRVRFNAVLDVLDGAPEKQNDSSLG